MNNKGVPTRPGGPQRSSAFICGKSTYQTQPNQETRGATTEMRINAPSGIYLGRRPVPQASTRLGHS